MSSPDLDALIVEHLADLDQIPTRINAIEKAVFTAMGGRLKNWLNRNGWVGEAEYPDDGNWSSWEIWFAPSEWRTPETAIDENEFDGSFTLGVGNGDTESGAIGEDRYILTRLCQAGFGQVGLTFCHSSFMKPRQWKQAFAQIREILLPSPFMAITTNNDPGIFLPFRIDADVLAMALRDEDPDAALAPFEAALDTLLDIKPHFDLVVQYLRSLAR